MTPTATGSHAGTSHRGPRADSPDAGAAPARAAAGQGGRTRTRGRRNWGLVAAGVGLMLLTTIVFGAVWAAGRTTTTVLALAATVHRGEVVEAADLTVAHAFPDPALHTIPASEVTSIVGRHAALDLPAGSLLTPDGTTADPVPGAGLALVGLRLSPSQLPLTPLLAGDSVTIVHAGRDGDSDSPSPDTIPATVVATGNAADGASMVDVTLADAQAAQVTAWVATGRAAIYRNSEVG